jgi:hypothetical protein
MKKIRIAAGILVIALTLSSNVYAQKDTQAAKQESVSVVDNGSYFQVTLDLKKSKSHRDAGEKYAEKILKEVPEYESLIDSYLTEMTASDDLYKALLKRVSDIKPQVDKDYRDEIEGMASEFSAGESDVRGDGKLSKEEIYMLNLFPDIARGTQCSALAVYGKRSATKSTMTARVLDWNIGSQNQLAKLQCVMTIKNGKKSICTIGYLGFLGVISGLNDNKVFAAILDAPTQEQYTSEAKRSYPFDIRYALENKNTITEVASFMKAADRGYTYGHLIFLSDPKTAAVLENNISNTAQSLRELRTEKSVLNDGIEWGIDNSIGTVNSYQLKGNLDNHTSQIYNTGRWATMKEQLKAKGDSVTLKELEEVITTGSGSKFIYEGALYNKMTQQIILFEPKNLHLKVFFRPTEGELPAQPKFETIKVKF